MSTVIRRVAVVGAGTMGAGIAQLAAVAGMETALTDSSPEAVPTALDRIRASLQKAVAHDKLTDEAAHHALSRIRVARTLEDAVSDADAAIETVVEDIAVKRELFAMLGRLAASDALLVTNTSSLSVAAIARDTTGPDRVIGMHFFNPVHVKTLVEIVVHDAVAPQVVERAKALAKTMGRRVIVVRDGPGFASTRLGLAIGLEAMRMLEEGVASAADIDTAMELGYGHAMGPLKTSDLVGLDVRLRIAEHLYRELKAECFAPPRILREKVARGELGRKTGKGFYDY